MNSVLIPKSESFALRIVETFKFLANEKREFVMSKQLLRAGTSIGANIAEANYAQTKPDFITKMTIALKETSETVYWLKLLWRSGYLPQEMYNVLLRDAYELIRLLTSTVKTARRNLEKS